MSTYDEAIAALARALRNGRGALFLGPSCSETAPLGAVGDPQAAKPAHEALAGALLREYERESGFRRPSPCETCGKNPGCCQLPTIAYECQNLLGPPRLADILQNQLQNGAPGELHRQLWALPWSAVYTLDYDDLLERALDGAQRTSPTRGESKPTGLVARREPSSRPVLRYLMGRAARRDAVVTTIERARLRNTRDALRKPKGDEVNDEDKLRFKATAELWQQFQQDVAEFCFLYIGYGLADGEVLDALVSTGLEAFPRSFALCEKGPPPAVGGYFRKFNVTAIQLTEAGKSTDEFFMDLVDAFRERQVPPPETPLAQRRPAVWKRLQEVLSANHKKSICVYGQSTGGDDETIASEFSWIPGEVEAEVASRRNRRERVALCRLSMNDLGPSVLSDKNRIVNLAREVMQRLAAAMSEPGQPVPADRITDELMSEWEADAKNAEAGSRKEEDAERPGKGNGNAERARAAREAREQVFVDKVAGLLATWLGDYLASEYRLMMMIVDFERIESDQPLLERVATAILVPLAKNHVSLFILRRAADPLKWPAKIGVEGTSEAEQIRL